MVRIILRLFLVAGFFGLMLSDPQIASAQKGGNSGTIKKVDAKNGVVTFTMQVPVKGAKKKTELGEREFILKDDAKVTIVEGGKKTEMTGKEAMTSGAIKEGTMATFVPEGDLKIKELTVGGGGKK